MHSSDVHIAPSILSADFRRLESEVKAAQDAGADRIHCDVMDGHFVPNLTFGPIVVEAVKKCVSIPLDVHLMIANPQKYLKAYCDAGSDVLMFHAEAVGADAVGGLLEEIRGYGVKSGVTVNPDKSVELFLDSLPLCDQVLIMSVYAGFGGQSFMPETMDKVRKVRHEARERAPALDIEVDGGVNGDTARVCAEAGVNVFVAGSYVFGSDNYRERIDSIRRSAADARRNG